MMLYSFGSEPWLQRSVPMHLSCLVSSLFVVGTAIAAAVVAES